MFVLITKSFQLTCACVFVSDKDETKVSYEGRLHVYLKDNNNMNGMYAIL